MNARLVRCAIVSAAFVLAVRSSVAQSPPLVDLHTQLVDNDSHDQFGFVFGQAGGFSPDGQLYLTPLQTTEQVDDGHGGTVTHTHVGFHAMVVRYGNFVRTDDTWQFSHSNQGRDPSDPDGSRALQYRLSSGVWLDDRAMFHTSTGDRDYLLDGELDDYYKGLIPFVYNNATQSDQPRLVNLASDPIDIVTGNPLSANPFPSDADGNVLSSGTSQYMTYRFVMLSGLVVSQNRLGTRRGFVVVETDTVAGESKRFPKRVVRAGFYEALQPLALDFVSTDSMYNYAQHVTNYNHDYVMGIEGSMSNDLNFLTCFGSDKNDGTCDSIVFSVRKPQPDGSFRYSLVRNISRVNADVGNAAFGQANTLLSGYAGTPLANAGILFKDKYRLAAKPLADSDGRVFNVNAACPDPGMSQYTIGERVLGDYPWLLPDGEMLTFQTTTGLDLVQPGSSIWDCTHWLSSMRARRGTMITVGESTLTNNYYQFAIADIPNNEFLFQHMKTNSTSSGRFNDAWDPMNFLPASKQVFHGVRTERGALGLYTVPSSHQHASGYDYHGQMWSENSFRPNEDKEYLVYSTLHPVPHLGTVEYECDEGNLHFKDKVYTDFHIAQDLSGNGNAVNLDTAGGGTKYPWEYYQGEDTNRDMNVGKIGQGVFLTQAGKISIPAGGNSTIYDFQNEATVDFFVKPITIPTSGFFQLVDCSSFRIEMDNSGGVYHLRATYYTTSLPSTHQSPSVATSMTANQWAHIAVTYQVGLGGVNPGRAMIYVNGDLVYTYQNSGTVFNKGGSNPKALVFGPASSTSSTTLMNMDEIALSDVARTADEIRVISLKRPASSNGDVTYGRSSLPLGITEGDLYVQSSQEYSAAKVNLGYLLFFDKTLSRDKNRSCATCHVPSLGYSDGLARNTDVDGNLLTNRTPAIANLAVGGPGQNFRWNGSASTLEKQTTTPMFGVEMKKGTMTDVQNEINAHWSTYSQPFYDVFQITQPSQIQETHIQQALAAFVRNLIAGNSPFDRFLQGDDITQMTQSQRNGWGLFRGKARCIACHSGAGFSDGQFYNTRVDTGLLGTDLLRYNVTNRVRDMGAAKVPGLRNVGRQDYFTHGTVPGTNKAQRLANLISDYDHGGATGVDAHIKVRPLGLTDTEKADLLEFLLNGLTTTSGYANDPFTITTPWP
jgi:cytochrome c peroxidase